MIYLICIGFSEIFYETDADSIYFSFLKIGGRGEFLKMGNAARSKMFVCNDSQSRIGNIFSIWCKLLLQMCNFLMFSGVLRFCSKVSTDLTKIRTTFVKHDYDTCPCVCGGTSLISSRRAIFFTWLFFHKRWR